MTKEENPLRVSPGVGWEITRLGLSEMYARTKYGTTLAGLAQQGENSPDGNLRLIEVVETAIRLIGPKEQFESDYGIWQETRAAGTHNLPFTNWLMARNEAYGREYARLRQQLEAGSSSADQ